MTREQADSFIQFAAALHRTLETAKAQEGVPPEIITDLQTHLDTLTPAVEVVNLLFFGDPGEGLAVRKDKDDNVAEVFVTKVPGLERH